MDGPWVLVLVIAAACSGNPEPEPMMMSATAPPATTTPPDATSDPGTTSGSSSSGTTAVDTTAADTTAVDTTAADTTAVGTTAAGTSTGGPDDALCQLYCDTFFANCTGPLNPYTDEAECLAVCAMWEPGMEGDFSGDTVWCRLTNAQYAKDAMNPDYHCPEASPDSQMCM